MEIEERAALLNERDQLKEAIQRVRELHELTHAVKTIWCDYCDVEYPCDTIKALDGEQ